MGANKGRIHDFFCIVFGNYVPFHRLQALCMWPAVWGKQALITIQKTFNFSGKGSRLGAKILTDCKGTEFVTLAKDLKPIYEC